MVGDQFDRWSTQILVGIAERVCTEPERSYWMATEPGVWSIANGIARRFCDGRAVRTTTEDKLRANVIEQLEFFGITIDDVNRMKS